MHALAKMAEMAINCRNRQTLKKNSNELVNGPFGKSRFWRKWRLNAKLKKKKFKSYGKGALWIVAISAKMTEMAINRQNCQIVNKNSNEMEKGPF